MTETPGRLLLSGESRIATQAPALGAPRRVESLERRWNRPHPWTQADDLGLRRDRAILETGFPSRADVAQLVEHFTRKTVVLPMNRHGYWLRAVHWNAVERRTWCGAVLARPYCVARRWREHRRDVLSVDGEQAFATGHVVAALSALLAGAAVLCRPKAHTPTEPSEPLGALDLRVLPTPTPHRVGRRLPLPHP